MGVPGTGDSAATRARRGEAGPPRGRRGALSAVLAARRPRGTGAPQAGANCVQRATHPNRGRARQLPWQRRREWGGA